MMPGQTCRNCGALAPGNFCPACGQSTAPHTPTVWAFLCELVAHYVALDGKLWSTLGRLLFLPGSLASDYFIGRRTRYISPLRLYLTFSILLFSLMGIFGGEVHFDIDPAAGRMIALDQSNPLPDWLRPRLLRFEQLSAAERREHVRTGFRQYTPYALFLGVPVLALLLKLAYWNRRRVYGEHLVFAFHVQTVIFIVLLGNIYLPDRVGNWLLAAFALHTLLSLRRVYGGRAWATLVRALALSGCYLLVLFVAVIGSTVVAVVV